VTNISIQRPKFWCQEFDLGLGLSLEGLASINSCTADMHSLGARIGTGQARMTSASSYRRSLWALLVFAGAVMTAYQIQNRIRYSGHRNARWPRSPSVLSLASHLEHIAIIMLEKRWNGETDRQTGRYHRIPHPEPHPVLSRSSGERHHRVYRQ